MATKKITLNELRSLVKQIINEKEDSIFRITDGMRNALQRIGAYSPLNSDTENEIIDLILKGHWNDDTIRSYTHKINKTNNALIFAIKQWGYDYSNLKDFLDDTCRYSTMIGMMQHFKEKSQ